MAQQWGTIRFFRETHIIENVEIGESMRVSFLYVVFKDPGVEV